MKTKLAVAATLLIVLLSAWMIFRHGGDSGDDGLKPQERQMAKRLDEIVTKTGGDWNKLTPADHDYLVRDIAQGSEETARMLLLANAGKLRGTPGGPPKQ